MWQVVRVVDLSMPLTGETPVFPGDPVFKLERASEIAEGGCSVHRLGLGTHTGTHVDAPSHTIAGGLTVDRLDLNLFVGEGVVIRVTGKQTGAEITLAEVRSSERLLKTAAVVLLHTGWGEKAGSEEYFDHPFLGEEACRYLLGQGIAAFGIDTPGIDSPEDAALPVHRLIAARGGVALENLANLGSVDFPHPLIACFPLRIGGADGSPVRAVALELAARPNGEGGHSVEL